MKIFDLASIFKLRDALLVVRKQVVIFEFELMFEGGPDILVLPFRVNSKVICSVLLITSKKVLGQHFIMFSDYLFHV